MSAASSSFASLSLVTLVGKAGSELDSLSLCQLNDIVVNELCGMALPHDVTSCFECRSDLCCYFWVSPVYE